MRICIPVTKNEIPNHLGHCDEFLFADVEGKEIRTLTTLKNPRHGPGGPPPAFVRSQGATHVLAWGIPPHAAAMFAQLGIAVTLGARGEPKAVLEAFLQGTLETTTEGLEAGCGGKGGCGGGHDHGTHHH